MLAKSGAAVYQDVGKKVGQRTLRAESWHIAGCHTHNGRHDVVYLLLVWSKESGGVTVGIGVVALVDNDACALHVSHRVLVLCARRSYERGRGKR